MCHCSSNWGGKAAERAGESEDLPGNALKPSWTGVIKDLEDKNGKSPDRYLSVRGFFYPDLQTELYVKKGDWVSMPQFRADGNVIDIALHHIKIQNWDKTIVTIPTHKFITESFTNWKGMQESGLRRICRSILIDMTSIAFLSKEKIDRFRKVHFLKDYINQKDTDIKEHNEINRILMDEKINGNFDLRYH